MKLYKSHQRGLTKSYSNDTILFAIISQNYHSQCAHIINPCALNTKRCPKWNSQMSGKTNADKTKGLQLDK